MNHTQGVAGSERALTPFIQGITEHLPETISFLVLILMGWILAWVLKVIAVRMMGGLERFLRGKSVDPDFQTRGLDRSVSEVVGKFVFWVVLFFFVVASTEALGLSIFSTLLSGIAFYLPNVLAAGLIGFVGYLGGNIARHTIGRGAAKAGFAYGDVLGRMAQALIWTTAFLIAVDQIGIKIEFLMILITMIIGTMLGGMALAFGLGAKTFVSNLIASHYLNRIYQVGQTIRIRSLEGRIMEITTSAVVLETREGQVLVPAREFSDHPSVLVTGGG